MATNTVVTIVCEACIESFGQSSTAIIIRFWAKEAGWFSNKEGNLDLCPNHKHLIDWNTLNER